MDEDELRLEALKLSIHLLIEKRSSAKTLGDIVKHAKYFSNYILDIEDDDEEEEPPKSDSSPKHGYELVPLSQNK